MARALLVAGRQRVAGSNLLTRTRTHETHTRKPARVAKPVQIPNKVLRLACGAVVLSCSKSSPLDLGKWFLNLTNVQWFEAIAQGREIRLFSNP